MDIRAPPVFDRLNSLTPLTADGQAVELSEIVLSDLGTAVAAVVPPPTTQASLPPDPPPFLVGTAISTFQNSGDSNNSKPESNWGEFAKGSHFCCIPHVRSGKKTNGRYWEYGTKVCSGPDFWNRYEEDIQAAKAIGCNSLRFSLEWSRIEPRKGFVDQAAMNRFQEIFDCIIANGMEPMPTFYHFVYPAWFCRMGGFAKKENIPLFVEFCKMTFLAFQRKARFWATINEPNVQVFFGYICGNHTPGSLLTLGKAGKVMCNLLLSHKEVYNMIKALPGGCDAQIGIVHNYMWFEPKGKGLLYAFTRYLCTRVNHWYGNDLFIEFFKTGRFKWEKALPACCGYVEHSETELPKMDWLGINYYTRSLMSPLFIPTCHKGEYMTDMPYRAYPQGLYEAVSHLSELGVPMYITETGVADRDDVFRERHIKDYMDQVERCVADGYDLRGVMYWTLVDNFEWDQGWTMHFGLYEFDPKTKVRRLREGAKVLKGIFEELPARVREMSTRGSRVANGNNIPAIVDPNGTRSPRKRS
mmetsp:Transcript_10072/g.28907  ORF Transcript_10072/g.28907 Transcript_10072/m.28907 type:complete len:528 (+) Transcript_10072:287-1870(+)